MLRQYLDLKNKLQKIFLSRLTSMPNMMKRFVQTYWSILILGGITLLIALLNFKTNTFLIGWDGLVPEFNFGINIQRSFFAVWQEYQGLGLLGGMGHASDLVRQLILLFLSVVFPNDMLRYLWTFLMLFIGATGAYFLSKK